MIRLAIPPIHDDDVAAVADVLRSGLLVQGRHVEAFERAVASYTGATHAVAVTSCTSALHLSLLATGIGPGDAVAVSAFSWPATVNVVALVGAEPMFVDIDPLTFNMDPHALAALMERERISAILPVHTFGGMADMDEIDCLARRHGAVVIEDAACALGASLNGILAGRSGRAGCFSFHPRKAITTGEGGVVVTDDGDLAVRLRTLRNHGIDPEKAEPSFAMPGFNARMTDFQGALGLEQMAKLEDVLSSRRNQARRYDALLADTEIRAPISTRGGNHVYQSYVVQLPEAAAGARDTVIAEMREAGIETTIGTYALPFIRWVRDRYGYTHDDFPVVSQVERRALCLPLHERLTERDQERIVAVLRDQVMRCWTD